MDDLPSLLYSYQLSVNSYQGTVIRDQLSGNLGIGRILFGIGEQASLYDRHKSNNN